MNPRTAVMNVFLRHKEEGRHRAESALNSGILTRNSAILSLLQALFGKKIHRGGATRGISPYFIRKLLGIDF